MENGCKLLRLNSLSMFYLLPPIDERGISSTNVLLS